MEYKIVFNNGNELIVEAKNKAESTIVAIQDGRMSKDDCYDIVGIFENFKPAIENIAPNKENTHHIKK